MTPQEFCYWLNGHFDLNPDQPLSQRQVEIIRQHLALVFDEQSIKFDPLKYIEGTPAWPGTWKPPIDSRRTTVTC